MNIDIDINKLIRAIDDAIGDSRATIDILGIDLRNVTPTAAVSAEWHCGVEGAWWPIEARRLDLSDEYAVRWTWTAEAGVDDVEIYEREDEDDEQQSLIEYLGPIAAGCGSCDGTVRMA